MARRLPQGGRIDRARPIPFSFDGKALSGFAGDTLASALLANGVSTVGRSFKYHRPRGVFGHWTEEPNAILDVTRDGRREPDARATTVYLEEGRTLAAASVNAAPDAERDRLAVIDAFARFLPAGFYYKTFLWPRWGLFEPAIRAMAGLGRLDPGWLPAAPAAPCNRACDVLVVGAGPAGLAAARSAAEGGRSVLLVDDRREPGGVLLWRGGEVEGQAAEAWIADTLAAIARAGGTVMSDTTAYGVYDHGLVCALQRGAEGAPDRLWRIRAGHIVVAAGAIERPLVFADNDLPGVLSAEAGLAYLRQYGVLVGERVVVAANNDAAYPVALALREAGAHVSLVDNRPAPRLRRLAEDGGVAVLAGERVVRAEGRRAVRAATLASGARIEADALLVSGGFTPTAHLYCQAKGKLAWDDALLAFVPGAPVEGVSVVGAANGVFGLAAAVAEARAAVAVPKSGGAPAARDPAALDAAPAWPNGDAGGRAWIDLQSDVTVKDVGIAARENYASVEHLKRYTTLGMATDQGKTSNVNGIAALAAATGRAPGEVGTTTYRPPYVPVPFSAIAGLRGGERMNPVRRLPLEARHRALGATLGEYGGWLRPAYYGPGDMTEAVAREIRAAREAVAVFDASPLGKIEVIGPDAARFMDFQSYMTLSTLAPGRMRYGFMLEETGIVFDDGVVSRLDENRFRVSCSTSHVAAMHARFETWRQDQFDPARLFIHNATTHWATLAVSGPLSRLLMERLSIVADLSDAALPHMAFVEGRFAGGPATVARVSFTGERGYEVSVPAARAAELHERLLAAGRDLGVAPLGIEALMALRAEKGFVVVGLDTDGTTMPHDLGFGGPRLKRTGDFVGKRSLFTQAAEAADRKQLVGLDTVDGAPLPRGAHVVARDGGRLRSEGFVTSSYASPALRRPVALGLVARGAARHGEEVTLRHLGRELRARLRPPCAYDAKGDRLNA